MDAFSDIKPVPPDVILSWPKPNYTDPDRRGPALLIVNCFLLPLAMVVVGMRLYTRLIIVHSAGLDDVFILTPFLIAAVGLTIAVCLAASQYGWDLHIWDVPEADIIPGRIVTWVAQLIFVAATNFTKLSILLFYTRLSTVGIRTPFDYAVWGTIVFVILYIISFSISVITACKRCTNSQAFVYAAAGFSIFEDFIIMMLPVWELKDLNLNLRKKIALIFLFALRSFACITSMIRLKYIIAYGTSVDVTYRNVDIVLWSVLEDYVAIICAGLMCFRPLVIRFLPSMLPTTSLSESKNPGSQA
ncbi:hypothetical protein VE01_09232 [Pseudogymnoascus verrucosus]|uniref:Rhodopsin domain-containing protein n=1 Tax=Pseudogymnoascus verrucosus TaxID=342668 RepID=A0A1B8GBF5_9PEZI|nr:uncharacterized protein VE01_09232 [Pseudogymnoascus verrucosus]OBT93162.1 hypothetical protein VE01_09232 [Pseudogymnoascus verrucosus]